MPTNGRQEAGLSPLFFRYRGHRSKEEQLMMEEPMVSPPEPVIKVRGCGP